MPTALVSQSNRRRVLGIAALAIFGAACLAATARRPGRSPTVPPQDLESARTFERSGGLDTVDARLTESERRGKDLYEKGVGASGIPPTAVLGDSAGEVPATLLRCVNCHGRDGRGTSEGGIAPPNITWSELTRPYGATTSTGRRRPPYNEALVNRGICLGVDSGGATLKPSMPRYRLGLSDAHDLIAYLKRLGPAHDPGITSAEIRVAALLPPARASGTLGPAVASALRAFVDDVNASGGVYGRRLALVTLGSAESAGDRLDQVDRLIESGDVFGLVASFVDGAETEIAEAARRSAVPLVGALTLDPRDPSPSNRYVFWVDGGVPAEARVLADQAVRERPEDRPLRAVILAPSAGRRLEVAREVESRLRGAGGMVWIAGPGPLDPVALHREGVETLVLLDGPSRWLPALRAADAAGWRPRVFLPGALATPDVFAIPKRFESEFVLAFASLLPVGGGGALDGYQRLSTKAGLPREHLDAQLSALASAAVLVEALKRSGRDLSRDGLVDQLERFSGYPTGFSPPVSFSPGRHVGIRGAFLVGLDRDARRFARRTGWIEPED